MLDSITVPRMPIHSNIARASRAVTILLSFELLVAFVLTLSNPGWQTFTMIIVILNLIVITSQIGSQARKAATKPWHSWFLAGSVWASLNIFTLLVAGAAIPFALTNVLFTISLAALVFGRNRSTTPIFIAIGTSLTILVIEYLLAPAFRQALPASFSSFSPALIVAITAGLLLFLLQQFALFSLRQKLVISFLVLSLIPVAAIRYVYDVSFRQALTESAGKNLSSVAAQTANTIDAFIHTNLDAVAIQANLPAFQRLLLLTPEDPGYTLVFAGAEELIYDLHELHSDEADISYLIGYSLINREGVVLLDSATSPANFNPEIGKDYSNDPIFLNPALLGLPYASPLRVSGDMQSSRIYFAQRITNEQNRPIGVFTVRFNARFLQDLLTENKDLAGPGSYGVLFDEFNIFLAHATQPDLVFRSVAGVDPAVFGELVTTGRLPADPNEVQPIGFAELDAKLDNSVSEPIFSIDDITNNNTKTQVATVRLSNYPWQIAFFQPEEIFLAPVITQTIFSVILSGVIALIAIFIALFASTQLANPILRLTEAAQEVTAGNLNVRANVDVQDEVGTLSIAFNSMTRQLRQTLENLEELVDVRTARLEATNEVGRISSSILNLDDLVSRIVNLITDRFGYYYAAIFLVDEENAWALLKDATGEAGLQLKTQGHRLQINGNNMVGKAIRTYEPQISQEARGDDERFANPMLPETRAEIALPLVVGDNVIGALDVQSRTPQAFDQQVIDTLQTLASQVSIAIENANLFEQTQQAAQTQQLINEFSKNIQKATDINSILSTTVNELSVMLDTAEISIQLAPENQLKKTANGSGTKQANPTTETQKE